LKEFNLKSCKGKRRYWWIRKTQYSDRLWWL